MGKSVFKAFTVVLMTVVLHAGLASAQSAPTAQACRSGQVDDCDKCPASLIDACYRGGDSSIASVLGRALGVSDRDYLSNDRYNSARSRDACYDSKQTVQRVCSARPNGTECKRAALALQYCNGNFSNPAEKECVQQSKDFNEQTKKIVKFCGSSGASIQGLAQCRYRMDRCSQAMNGLGNSYNGMSPEQQKIAYGQFLQSVSGQDPQCWAVMNGVNEDYITDTRKKAEEDIKDIEEKLRDMQKDRLKDQLSQQEKLQDLQKSTVEKVEELTNKVDDLDDARREKTAELEDAFRAVMEDVELKGIENKEKFKEAAMKAKEAVDKLEAETAKARDELDNELRALSGIKPQLVNMKFEEELAKIESECLKVAREKAEKKRLENEGKKARNASRSDGLNNLLNSTSKSGNAQKRYNFDKAREMKLCLQDKASLIENYRKMKEVQIQDIENQKVALQAKKKRLDDVYNNQLKNLEITMQDLVEAAKDKDQVIRNAAANKLISIQQQKNNLETKVYREQQKARDKAVWTQQFFMQQVQQMQYAASQTAQQQYSLTVSLYQKQLIAQQTLAVYPPGVGKRNTSAVKDYDEAMEAIDMRENYRGGPSCCSDQDFVNSAFNGRRPSFCEGIAYQYSPSIMSRPTWGTSR